MICPDRGVDQRISRPAAAAATSVWESAASSQDPLPRQSGIGAVAHRDGCRRAGIACTVAERKSRWPGPVVAAELREYACPGTARPGTEVFSYLGAQAYLSMMPVVALRRRWPRARGRATTASPCRRRRSRGGPRRPRRRPRARPARPAGRRATRPGPSGRRGVHRECCCGRRRAQGREVRGWAAMRRTSRAASAVVRAAVTTPRDTSLSEITSAVTTRGRTPFSRSARTTPTASP
jgi:hypothetical protein